MESKTESVDVGLCLALNKKGLRITLCDVRVSGHLDVFEHYQALFVQCDNWIL